MTGHWSDWLFWIGGWALAGGGVLLLVWAVVGDRSRGRRRCRKCWYDMGSIGAVEGEWVCPECGKRAGRERLLLRSRRQWRWAGVACLLLVAAYPAYSVPAIRRDGWVTAVPSSVLVFIAPMDDSDVSVQGPFMGVHSIRLTPQTSLLRELLTRAEDRALAEWQYQVLIDRLIELEPLFFRGGLLIRDPWPVGEPLVVRPILLFPNVVRGDDWLMRVRARGEQEWLYFSHSGEWRRYQLSNRGRDRGLGTFPAGRIELEAELLIGIAFVSDEDGHFDLDLSNARSLWRGSIGTITIAGTAGDLITPHATERADRAVSRLVEGVTTNEAGRPQLLLRQSSGHIGGHEVDWGLGFRAEVLVDSRVVAAGSGLYHMIPINTSVTHLTFGPRRFGLEWTDEPLDLGASDNVTVRLTDDPRMAIRDLTRTIFWSGSVSVPIGSHVAGSRESRRKRVFEAWKAGDHADQP